MYRCNYQEQDMLYRVGPAGDMWTNSNQVPLKSAYLANGFAASSPQPLIFSQYLNENAPLMGQPTMTPLSPSLGYTDYAPVSCVEQQPYLSIPPQTFMARAQMMKPTNIFLGQPLVMGPTPVFMAESQMMGPPPAFMAQQPNICGSGNGMIMIGVQPSNIDRIFAQHTWVPPYTGFQPAHFPEPASASSQWHSQYAATSDDYSTHLSDSYSEIPEQPGYGSSYCNHYSPTTTTYKPQRIKRIRKRTRKPKKVSTSSTVYHSKHGYMVEEPEDD